MLLLFWVQRRPSCWVNTSSNVLQCRAAWGESACAGGTWPAPRDHRRCCGGAAPANPGPDRSPFNLSPLSAPSFSSTRVHGPLETCLPFDAMRTMELSEKGRSEGEREVGCGACAAPRGPAAAWEGQLLLRAPAGHPAAAGTVTPRRTLSPERTAQVPGCTQGQHCAGLAPCADRGVLRPLLDRTRRTLGRRWLGALVLWEQSPVRACLVRGGSMAALFCQWGN